MRTSKLHDNLVLQVSYLIFICSIGGHQWLTMSPESVERKKSFCSAGSLSAVLFVSSKPLVIRDIIGFRGVTTATHKDNLVILFHLCM